LTPSAFDAEIEAMDPTPHQDLASREQHRCY